MFGILIDQISYVLGIANQAKGLATKAYEYVDKKLSNLSGQIEGIVKKLVDVAEKRIYALFGVRISDVLTVITRLRADTLKLIDTIEKNAYRYTTELVTQLHGIIRKEFDKETKPLKQTIADLLVKFNTVKGIATKSYEWVNKEGARLWSKLNKLADYLDNGKLAVLVDLIERQYDWIIKFRKNPGEHLLSYLETVLLDMLFWLLAKGMGTTNRQLPAKPKY